MTTEGLQRGNEIQNLLPELINVRDEALLTSEGSYLNGDKKVVFISPYDADDFEFNSDGGKDNVPIQEKIIWEEMQRALTKIVERLNMEIIKLKEELIKL